MKLYILYNNKDKVLIAISEIKEYLYRYIIQNNYSDSYKVIKIVDNKTIDKYLLLYDNLYLDEIEGIILTLDERRIIYSEINQCEALVEDTILNLSSILNEFNLNDKEYKHIQKTIKILSNNIKPKKMNIFFNIKECIVRLFIMKRDNVTDIFKEHNELRDKYLIKINLK